jgi:hypothetical protein
MFNKTEQTSYWTFEDGEIFWYKDNKLSGCIGKARSERGESC